MKREIEIREKLTEFQAEYDPEVIDAALIAVEVLRWVLDEPPLIDEPLEREYIGATPER